MTSQSSPQQPAQSGSRFVRFEFVGQGLTLTNLDGAPNVPIERFGPFDTVIVIDGAILADDRPFAKLMEEKVVWHILDTKTCSLNTAIESDHDGSEAIVGVLATQRY